MDVAILVMACHSNRPTGWCDDAEIIRTVIITSSLAVAACDDAVFGAIIGGFETGHRCDPWLRAMHSFCGSSTSNWGPFKCYVTQMGVGGV